jgi:hypothetical protein
MDLSGIVRRVNKKRVKPENSSFTRGGRLDALFLCNFETDFTRSDFTKRSDNLAVVFGFNQRLSPFIELFNPLCSQYYELESVLDFFQTIFNGYPSHTLTPSCNLNE